MEISSFLKDGTVSLQELGISKKQYASLFHASNVDYVRRALKKKDYFFIDQILENDKNILPDLGITAQS